MKKYTTLLALLFIGVLTGYCQQSAYLFVYFTGNRMSEEAIRMAVSLDGYNYKALNGNQPVLDSRVISSTGGVRDPHILRCENGKTFYMVVTDMVSGNGWDSNRAMVLLKSKDLVHWTSNIVNIQKKYPAQENLKRVWAPQTVYDKEAGKYMVYWSMKHGNGADIIYYAYANKDFTDLEGEPKSLFLPKNGKSCIDGDIIYKDGLYHLFYKTEGDGNGIKKATTVSPDFRTMDGIRGIQTADERSGRRFEYLSANRFGQVYPDVRCIYERQIPVYGKYRPGKF